MKNRKGFTMAELLAVIVIMGILSIMVAPKLFDLITNGRNKVYVQDARRLLSQVQYMVNSTSNNIRKPNTGACIVMSLKHLNSSDFSSSPHGGQYMVDESYVILRANSDGSYSYSVVLVEQTADSRMFGMPLMSEEDISKDSSISKVKEFSTSEVKKASNLTTNSSDKKFLSGGFMCPDAGCPCSDLKKYT